MQGTETTDGVPSPAPDRWIRQELGHRGRHVRRVDVWADIATAVHQSWIRRDLWGAFIPAVVAALLVH